MATELKRVSRLADGRWIIEAHAKLNLGLRVFPARPDGFHDLETWMVPTSWYDTLWIEVNGEPLKLEVTGRAEGVPTEIGKNLVGRAAVALAANAGMEAKGKITLHKVLPPGGGIGGGSADAACALVALNEAWGLALPAEDLERIAATLGSDIPFFVRGRPMLCTGRGEIMTPLPAMQPLFAVLVIPPQGCPTKDVYQAFDRGHQHVPARMKTDWKRCAAATAEDLSEMLVNDLEPAAFAVAPWLAELQQRTAAGIARKVHMTGSGSTLFTLCSSGAEGEELRERMEKVAACPCVAVAVLR